MGVFSQVYICFVFGVKYRQAMIASAWRDSLYSVIGQSLKECGCMPIAIGGVGDHVHVLFGYGGTLSLSEIAKKIKIGSTRWVNGLCLCQGKFGWQSGLGRFSYSHSQIPAVKRYIANQAIHHRTVGFREEFVNMLDKFEIPYELSWLPDELI